MSNIKGFVKDGWHPKGKDGGRESWRGDFKGVNQMAGWVGKSKSANNRSSSSGGSEHISRPLATLKDPAAFGPPPKNVNFHGGAALPNEITPDTRGLGAPLSTEQIQAAERVTQNGQDEVVEERVKPAGPPVPYRANRTGLTTDNLPPPPVHRTLEGSTAQETGITRSTTKPKPSLPPRLPPRSNSSNLTSPVTTSSPPPTYDSVVEEPKPARNTYLNQGAVNRLGKAGISVPGLGIGQSTKAAPNDQIQSNSSPSSQLNELQSRFSRIKSSPTSPSPAPVSSPPPSQGTTLAQKQSALKTAQSFQKDPSSVSLADAQSAASTANNFRERHQEQITAGAQKANSWNKKYNITGRVNSFLEQQASPAQERTEQQMQEAAPQSPQNASQAVPDLSNRKPPPPPPPKKPSGMHGQAMSGQSPPPVPLGTKPSFG